MALIRCKECGKKISDKAKTCPNCGCPLSEILKRGVVRIKMPNNIVQGWVGLFSSRDARVEDSNGNVLWEGKHGENAIFEINEPKEVTICLGGWANDVSGIVEPNKKYALVQDLGVHMFATYRITEVDVIDAD